MNNIGSFDPNLNPLSSKFLQRATDNMSTQMNTVRTQDETKPDDDVHEREIQDLAFLDASTVTSAEGFEAASYSGELGEMTDDLVEDDQENVEESRRHVGKGESEELGNKGFAKVRAEQGVDGQKSLERTASRDRDKVAEIRADVPDEVWAASASMVQGQMVGKTPKAGLMQMKSIPEPGQLEMGHADYAEMMDLTERQTGPLPVEVDAA